ncbi:hypothetical protein [Agromyces seonyuensis]|uniref:Uncharacterized protein n=1 Tax=Agromyces seonyuensis TaxID=2662446 RepID=A0A6I4P5X3_9MICO|nr:hypothetical protein [Agromyces seonyuensis]MWB98894.1 hypothetical protein [Agromyces seonyuensis]
MTAVPISAAVVREDRFRFSDVARVVKLHFVNPSIYFGVPWLILGGAWALSVLITLIIRGASPAVTAEDMEGMRNSWAVISPQWYLVVVGVQAVAFTFNFALGLGSTRRDYWLGTSLVFLVVAAEMATGIALLVQLEQATGGWWLGAHMFDALWFGIDGFWVDWFSAFALQLFVLFVGAAATTIYLRWRMAGMLVSGAGLLLLVVGGIAIATFTETWPEIFAWLGEIGIVGVFTLVLGLAVVSAALGYVVIRRATPR